MAPVSTGALEIPLEIIDRFRARALERIGVLEAHWQGLTSRETADPRAVEDMRREIHTLKGDARVVGFIDASLLSHKLEELLAAAHRLDYRVAGDFDPVVTRGFRFLAALVREGAGGIDLDGFLVEAERVLRGAGPVPLPDEHQPTSQPHRDRLGLETRLAMAAAATAVFLEHLSATGRSRERLYGAWRALSGQLAAIGAVGLRALVAPHTESVTRLAADLGKSVDVEVDVADGSVAAEAAEAIDAALRQVLHGAVSHGLEAPEARRLAGKRPDGRIALRVRLRPSGIEIEVEDDGAGLDVSSIRRRAVERGLIAERPAASASHDELVELLFQPGFSTSRGAGLHAVRATLEREGGSIAVLSRPGSGTTFVLHIPRSSPVQPVDAFPAAGMSLTLAIAARPGCSLRLERGGESGSGAVDPLARLGVAATADPGAASQVLLLERRGEPPLRLCAAGPPVRTSAERVCPTGDDQAAEVVLIDGVEALLVRPAHMGGSVR